MERREVLKHTAYFLGLSLCGSTISAIMQGCAINDAVDWTPSFLTADEAHFLEEFAETMLPRTQTPGAKDAMVVRFIDTVRPLRFDQEDNDNFKSNLRAFIDLSAKELGKAFTKSTPEKKLEWLSRIDKASYESVSEEKQPDERPFYLALKEQILAGYFNSEIVAMEYFNFDPIPGTYAGCIPYTDIGRAWAL